MAMFNQWMPPQNNGWSYPQPQPQSQMPTVPQSNLDWIMVNSVDQVERVTVQPGQKAWIMVQNDTVFALRVADQMGLVTTDYYRFEKWSPSAQHSGTFEFVTRQEMETAIASALASIKEASV